MTPLQENDGWAWSAGAGLPPPGLLKALEAKDPSGPGHAARVGRMTIMLAIRLHLRPEECKRLWYAARFHDVGKLMLPSWLLGRRGPLSRQEFELIEMHPVCGAEMVARVATWADLKPLILFHHEHHDGNGYPDGRAGDRIPLGARIIHVADALDAMLSPRTYRPQLGLHAAAAELARCASTGFDPGVAEAAVACLTGPKALADLPAGWATAVPT